MVTIQAPWLNFVIRTMIKTMAVKVAPVALIACERRIFVGELLDLPSTLDAVEAVLRDQAEGKATNRARRRVSLPKSSLNYMAAGAPGIGALGLKAYSVARTGARFYTMLFDPESGKRLDEARAMTG